MPGAEHVFGDFLVAERHEDRHRRLVAVDGPLLDRRDDLGERHRHSGGADPAQRLQLDLAAEHADLLAPEIGELADRRRGRVVGIAIAGHADRLQPLGLADRPEQLLERGIVQGALAMRDIVEYTGRGDDAVTRIDPGEGPRPE